MYVASLVLSGHASSATANEPHFKNSIYKKTSFATDNVPLKNIIKFIYIFLSPFVGSQITIPELTYGARGPHVATLDQTRFQLSLHSTEKYVRMQRASYSLHFDT
jgi:hypothetical protein